MSKGVTMKLSGFDAIHRRLEDINREIEDEIDQLIEDEANALLKESQEIVPYDTGELHDSGFVEVQRDGDRVTAIVGYSADHALRVHELMDLEHPRGQAKYLEQPFYQRQAAWLQRIRDRIRARIAGKR